MRKKTTKTRIVAALLTAAMIVTGVPAQIQNQTGMTKDASAATTDKKVLLFTANEKNYYLCYNGTPDVGEDFTYHYSYSTSNDVDNMTDLSVSELSSIFTEGYPTLELGDTVYSLKNETVVPWRAFSDEETIEFDGDVTTTHTLHTGSQKYTVSLPETITDGDAEYTVGTDVTGFSVKWQMPGEYNQAEKNSIHVANDTVNIPLGEWVNKSNDNTFYARFNVYGLDKNNNTDGEDANWKFITGSNVYTENMVAELDKHNYRYYKVQMIVMKDGNDETYLLDSSHVDEYNVSSVIEEPVSFFNDNEGFYETYVSESDCIFEGANQYKIEAPVLVKDGYDVEYQWYLHDEELEGETKSTLTIPEIAMGDDEYSETLKYKLVAKAKDKEGNTVSEALYSHTIYVTRESDDFEVLATSTWDGRAIEGSSRTESISSSIGSEIEAHLDLEIKKGVKVTYQWYDTLRNDAKYVDGYSYESGNYVKEIKGATDSSYSFTLKESDFVYINEDDEEVATTCYKILKVKAETSDGTERNYSYILSISENPRIGDQIYDEKTSDRTIETNGKSDVKICAPLFGVPDNYKLTYTWFKEVTEDTGEKDYQEIEDNDTATDRMLILEAGEEAAGKYRCFISIERDGKYEVKYFNNTIYRDYTVVLKEEEEVVPEDETVFRVERTSDRIVEINTGDSATLSINVVTNLPSVEYVWFHDGKVIEGATKNELKISSAEAEDFGKYYCNVYAYDEGENGKYLYDTAEVYFEINQVETISTNTPEYSYVYNAEKGDEINLSVDVTSTNGRVLNYQWYVLEPSQYEVSKYYTFATVYGNYDEYEKLDSTSPVYDFVYSDDINKYYRCVVTDGVSTRYFYFAVYPSTNNYFGVKGADQSYVTKTVNVGDSIKLEVESEKDDDVEVKYTWLKESNYHSTSIYDGIEYALLTNETSDTLEISNIEEKDICNYRCYADFVKDGEIIYSKYVTIALTEYEDIEILEDESYEVIREYGVDGYNRTSDEVRFGVETKYKGYKYEWSFAKEVFENGERKYLTDYPVVLSTTDPLIEYDEISLDKFGIYTLTIKKVNEDGSETVKDTEEFTLRRYLDQTFLLTFANGSTRLTMKRAVGEEVQFSVEPHFYDVCTEPIKYQWYFDGYAIAGANSATYSLDNLKRSDFGGYTCIVKCGNSTASVHVTLAKTDYLKVDTDVIDSEGNDIYQWVYNKKLGESVNFKVNASTKGTNPISYHWRFQKYSNGYYEDFVELKNTSDSLAIDSIDEDDYGNYYCVVTNGVEADSITCRFNLRKQNNTFLAFVKDESYVPDYSSDNYYVIYDDKTQYVRCVEGESVTFDATAVASEGENITYEWSYYDNVQKRYVTIENATGSTYTVDSATWSQLNLSTGADYKCIVSTEENSIYFYGYLFNNSSLSVKKSTDIPYAMEGTNVTFNATYHGKADNIQYKWYRVDENNQRIEIPGENSPTLTVAAPMVTRVDPNNPTVKQQNYEEFYFQCLAIIGEEDTETRLTASTSVNSVMKPDTFTELPKARLSDGFDVKAVNVPGSGTISLKFSDEYELGGVTSTLYIFDEYGNVQYYDFEDQPAGQVIEVAGPTAYLVYDCMQKEVSPLIDKTKYRDVDLEVLSMEILMSKLKHGYEVVAAKDKTVYEAEVAMAAAAQAAQAAQEASEAAKRDKMLQEAYEYMLKQKVKDSVTASGSGVVSNGLLTVNKGKVVVAPGKTIKIPYTAYDLSKSRVKASIATQSAADKAIAEATVISDSEIEVKVPAKAVKGSSVTFKVMSGTDVVEVKVYVRNLVKKIVAVKKKVNVKKKKSTKVKFKIVAENKDNPTTLGVKKLNATLAKKVGKVKKKAYKNAKKYCVVTVKAGEKKAKGKLLLKYKKLKAATKVVVK